ncbi:MAG TPA: OmpA family protein [Noviherbaspirillum sp.]|nr:OmpA family protein [Noviherbaspirillum sp.]
MPTKAACLCTGCGMNAGHARYAPENVFKSTLTTGTISLLQKQPVSNKTMIKTLALGFSLTAAASALAQTVTDIQANPSGSAYLQDSRGVIARSPFGLCWRAGSWTPADAMTGCDGELVPPVAKPTAPAIIPPIAAPAPATPTVTQRCDFSVTLGSDQTFPFNKASLSDMAKRRINDEVLARLAKCSRIDLVMVTGHTDRLGSQQYNQKLSEKRANAVSTYLKNRGVTAEIETLGTGKTQSVQSCPDTLPRSKLIACLAPNRRVVIEVRGSAR